MFINTIKRNLLRLMALYSQHISTHNLHIFAFEISMVLRIFGPKKMKKQEAEEQCIIRYFLICTRHQILLG
jgi:hypothetical protein